MTFEHAEMRFNGHPAFGRVVKVFYGPSGGIRDVEFLIEPLSKPAPLSRNQRRRLAWRNARRRNPLRGRRKKHAHRLVKRFMHNIAILGSEGVIAIERQP
jgi:hypothetical protein